MPVFRPRIAIAGGGPGGLSLGRLLHQRGIRATIYELRAKTTLDELAKPSGMLDLHEESGLKALSECGLREGFQEAMGGCSESMRVLDPSGTLLHSDEGELSTRPEIARNALTGLLIQSVPSDSIKWNHKIKTVQSNRNTSRGATEITLNFGAKSASSYDFIVGADGAWSKVRNLLTDVKPFYAGAQLMTATVRHVSTRYPHLLEVSGSGTACALGGGNGIMTHRGPQDSIRMYVVVSTPHANWIDAAKLQGKTAADMKKMLLGDDGLFRKWAPSLQDLLATACDEEAKDNPDAEADIKPMYMLPVGHRWEQRTGATLIGDAAHLMTPWAGEGVNLALWDSMDLANTLASVPEVDDAASWQEALEPRLREFEDTMLARAAVKAEETDKNRAMFLSDDGAQQMAGFFKIYEEMGLAGGPHEGSKMEAGS